MSLSCQQKITAALLTLYWSAFFVAAHTPIPQVVREAGVSDKCLHFLAYLILVFLLWFTVSDGRKVNWRKAAPWCLFFITIVYGILDEWSQSFVAGRSCDARDLLADLAAICLGLCVFSFLSFWPAGFFVVNVIILIGANVARANLSDLLPVANAAFHLISYAVVTALWLRCIHLYVPALDPRRTRAKWLLASLGAPTGLMAITRLLSIVAGRKWAATDVIFSVGAMAAVVAAFYLLAVYGKESQDVKQGDRLA